MTYVILTSKPGQFRTEVVAGMRAIESYEYVAFGRQRARFVIAELAGPTKVRIVDEAPPPVVNLVPTKFLAKFASVESARRELEDLAAKGGAQCSLLKVAC